jgi:hypothetical protein
MQVAAATGNMESVHPNKKQCNPAPVETLRVKKITEFATIPSRGSALAAGYDLSRYVNSANEATRIVSLVTGLIWGERNDRIRYHDCMHVLAGCRLRAYVFLT